MYNLTVSTLIALSMTPLFFGYVFLANKRRKDCDQNNDEEVLD